MLILHKKQLNKAYKRRFKILNRAFFKSNKQGLVLFEEYLKYIRDCIILGTTESADETVELNIATITAATAELASYRKEQEAAKKEFHWNNFCELLRLNMEEWLVLNDSI